VDGNFHSDFRRHCYYYAVVVNTPKLCTALLGFIILLSGLEMGLRRAEIGARHLRRPHVGTVKRNGANAPASFMILLRCKNNVKNKNNLRSPVVPLAGILLKASKHCCAAASVSTQSCSWKFRIICDACCFHVIGNTTTT